MRHRLQIMPGILLAIILVLLMTKEEGQDRLPDTSDVFYQEYLNRLVEDLRLSQIQELARSWGVVVGGRQFRMNRSFWEQRLSVNLWLGLSSGSDLQTAVVEYQVLPKLMLRGEIGHRAARSEAWLDFIFHTEY